MSTIRTSLLRGAGLALLAAGTFSVTTTLTRKPAAASSKVAIATTTPRQEIEPDHEALRASNRKPFISYREIVDILPLSDAGHINLLVDVECWHGSTHIGDIPQPERANRVRACVYSPADPHRQGWPIAVWESDAVEIVEGLYQERVPVSIRMKKSEQPYPVTVEIVSASPIPHKRLDSDEAVSVPRGYSGESVMVSVR